MAVLVSKMLLGDSFCAREDRPSVLSFCSLQMGPLTELSETHTKLNVSFDNVRHSRKDQSSLIGILRVYLDLSPVNVHRTVEEESVERFKLNNLGLGEIADYVEPYFRG